MSDSRRSRRVGDETRQRIDELADGWEVAVDRSEAEDEAEEGVAPEAETTPQRAQASSTPTPPPHAQPPDSRAPRKTLPPPTPRGQRDSRPPPVAPGPRSRRDSSLPPPPPRAKHPTDPPPRAKHPTDPPPRAKRPSVPAPRGKTGTRPPPIAPRPSTGKTPLLVESSAPSVPASPERSRSSLRARPPSTQSTTVPAKETSPRTGRIAAAVRAPASLPRKRGLYGDLLYVKSVLFGVTGDRRELMSVAKQSATLGERTRQVTVDLGRRALADSDYSDPDGAREDYVAFEEERSKKAGAVAATEEEIADEQRKLEVGDKAAQARVVELETELKALEKELAPIEKGLAKARRRSADLKGSITQLDQQITELKARVPAEEDEDDAEANLAALRADRDALIAEEPEAASELDRLGPFRDDLASRIAAHKEQIASLRQASADTKERADEVVAALEARLTVERRALSDIDEHREKMFEAVGKAMIERRHVGYMDLYRLIDDYTDEIAALARRERELEERLAVIDRAKLTRGILLLVALIAVIGAAIALFLSK